MNKKIMFVTPYFYPSSGGVENYIYNMAKGLHRSYKWDIVVVTSNSQNKKIERDTKDGITVYRLPSLFTISNTPINPFWFFYIKKIIAKEKPQLINAHAPVPFIADITALVSGSIPFILTYHAGTMKKGRLLADSIISFYETVFFPLLCKKANLIICSSEYVRNSMMKGFRTKSVIISPAVDITLFKPKKRKKSSDSTVLFIARHANMYHMKGLFYLIRAIQGLPNITLNIIGEKIDSKEKNIRFLGIKTGKELVKEIQQASIVALPSLSNVESFGMVLLEAMACKVPVIGTNSGGIPEIIIDKQDGLLVAPNNVKALRQAVETLSQNKRLAKKLGENAYRKVTTLFTWKIKCKQTQHIFSQYLPQ